MQHSVSGTFKVTITPLEGYAQGQEGIALGRMAIDKVFQGALAAQSQGEMLSARTPVTGSAGYVALEQVTGSLSGKVGSFVLQHFGMMAQGKDSLILEVVPDSGTQELSGLIGKMVITVAEGEHHYTFDYSLTRAYDYGS